MVYYFSFHQEEIRFFTMQYIPWKPALWRKSEYRTNKPTFSIDTLVSKQIMWSHDFHQKKTSLLRVFMIVLFDISKKDQRFIILDFVLLLLHVLFLFLRYSVDIIWQIFCNCRGWDVCLLYLNRRPVFSRSEDFFHYSQHTVWCRTVRVDVNSIYNDNIMIEDKHTCCNMWR